MRSRCIAAMEAYLNDFEWTPTVETYPAGSMCNDLKHGIINFNVIPQCYETITTAASI